MNYSVMQGGDAGDPHVITTTPFLGALGNHGGPTQTISLLTGSSAIDVGSGPVPDQSDVTRPQGVHCVSAFEVVNTPPAVRSITRFGNSSTDAFSVDFMVTFSESATGVEVVDFALTTSDILGTAVSGYRHHHFVRSEVGQAKIIGNGEGKSDYRRVGWGGEERPARGKWVSICYGKIMLEIRQMLCGCTGERCLDGCLSCWSHMAHHFGVKVK